MPSKHNHDDYTVGWICALPRELAAAQCMLDEEHDLLWQDPTDPNQYTLGRIGTHYVVLACLPAGEIGVVATATIATRMLFTFRRLQFGFLVGVGGGIPSAKHDIRLGDVVVGDSGVIHYDMGKTVQGGRRELTQSPKRPAQAILLAVSKLKARYHLREQRIMEYVDGIIKQHPEFGHRGMESDVLYHTNYDHPKHEDSCARCDPERIVSRDLRPSIEPVVHYGLIGSGNQVMKDAPTRDALGEEHDFLCFEMEAAGLMNILPALVVRGICDYSDSHKNKQWQDYASMVAAAYAKELLGIMQGPIGTAKSLAFMVPFQKTPQFVGRKDILTVMGDKVEAQQPVVLAGIGGVGKTQLTVQFCYQFRENHPNTHVFWVNASTVETFEQGYRDIARLLCVPGHESPEFNPLSEIHRIMSGDGLGRWLMVLDNLDDSQALAAHTKFIPQLRQTAGSLIVTTRDKRVSQNLLGWDHMTLHPIAVPPLDPREARSLVESALSPEQRLDDGDLLQVLEFLGYFPLALTQAIAFIKHNCTTVTKYKSLLEHSDSLVVHGVREEEYRDVHRYETARDSVHRTWEISFQQIQNESPNAAKLLAWMSVLDAPLGVPEILLCERGLDDLELTKGLGILKSFSLVTEGQGGGLIMHHLVQIAVHGFLDPDQRERHQNEALGILATRFPEPKPELLGLCEQLLPHAEEVLRYKFSKQDLATSTNLHRATVLHDVAAYKTQRGEYQSSETQADEAYMIRRKHMGEGSVEALASLELVALLLVNRGKYKAAQEMQQTVLRARKAAVGMDELLILESERRLAEVSLKLGQLKNAGMMYEEALNTCIKLVGDADLNTLELMDHYGEVLEYQGRFTEAQKMYQKALRGKRATLDEGHESTVKTEIFLKLLLASASKHDGEYEKAHELYCDAMEMSKSVHGEKHPETVRLNCNIASLYAAQNRWIDAEKAQLQAYQMLTEILGPNHPSTLVCYSNLAVLKQQQKQYEDAERLHRGLLARRTTLLGEHHPHTLASMYHLAEVLTAVDEHQECQELFEKALDGKRSSLGRKHPDTLRCMSSLAGVYYELKRFDDAERLYRESLELKTEVLGPKHPESLIDMNDLAEVLRQMDKLPEAESILRKLLQVQSQDSPDRCVNSGNLGRVLCLQGKYDEGIRLYEETLQQLEEGDPFVEVLSKRLETALRDKRESQLLPRMMGWLRWMIGR